MALAESTELDFAPATQPASDQSTERRDPMDLVYHAMERGLDPDVMDRMIATAERLEARQNKKLFDAAMVEAKPKVETVVKRLDGANKAYKFEDIHDLRVAVDAALMGSGLSFKWEWEPEGQHGLIACVVSGHGHQERTILPCAAPDQRNKMTSPDQAARAVRTPLRRETLMMAFGLTAAREEAASAPSRPEYDIEGVLHTIDNMESRDVAISLAAELKKGTGELIGHPPQWALFQLQAAFRRRVDAIKAEQKAAADA